MTKINECDIVRDLIPLYIDHVVSEASEELVANHVETCPECKKFLEETSSTLVIPVSVEERMEEQKAFEKFKKAINKKVWKIAIISSLCVLLLVGGIVILNRLELDVDSSAVTFYEADGKIVMSFPGDLRWSADGKETNKGSTKWTIQFHQTFWDRYISPIYDPGEHKYYFYSVEKTDEIYDDKGNLLWSNEIK